MRLHLVGYALKYDNFVWGLSGTKNTTKENTYEGYVMIGYLPDKSDYENAQLVYQGLFSWKILSTGGIHYKESDSG